MASFLTAPVQPALPHALPFRTLFEELRHRHERELLELVPRTPGMPPGATPFDQLLAAIQNQELAYSNLQAADTAIGDGRKIDLDPFLAACRDADAPLKRLLHAMDTSALCLSGGGIRSASFCLGVLEGLARFSLPDGAPCNDPAGPLKPPGNLMESLDYLSTVSGGGYIGSWLSSWIFRRWGSPTGGSWRRAYHEVVCALAGHSPVTAGDPEPQPVRHLRSYTSFLAPELGLTLDTFTLAAIVLRNLLVNWTMLIPVLFALISFTKGIGFLTRWAESNFPSSRHSLLLGFITGALFVAAALIAAFALPSHARESGSGWFRRHAAPLYLLAVLLGSWFLTVCAGPLSPNGWSDPHLWMQPAFISTIVIALFGYGLLSLSIWRVYEGRVSGFRGSGAPGRSLAPLVALIACLVSSALAAFLLLLIRWKLYPLLRPESYQVHHAEPMRVFLHTHTTDHRLFLVLALPLVLTVLMAVTTIFCALMNRFEMEEDREWWARCGGVLIAFGLFWIIAQGMVFYGEDIWHRIIAGIAGLILGAISSFIGHSGVTSAGPRPIKSAQLSKIGAFLEKHHLLLPVIGGIAVFLISLGVVAGEEALRKLMKAAYEGSPAGCIHGHANLVSAAGMFLASAVLAVLLNLAININVFSLSGMYRMRLMRAFLGASNAFRHPDPFTDFDPRDTPHERALADNEGAPLHLINATLNLTGTKNPAWRQRKAESFTFSPLYCGGWRVGYVPTPIYGGTLGITLATAMSISGAAFNPNMGYQSSPVLSLLMTFFNLRLGYWLPNPARPNPARLLGVPLPGRRGESFFRRSGPSFALWPLIAEALGRDDDRNRWIELTDGGHFENLGLYEMVLRRVKHIIVVDSGADPLCQFEDLGNAIRKIYIDLGIPIEFPAQGMKMHAGMDATNSYCAVANISYHCVDHLPGKKPEEIDGRLVYIKAGLTGSEPTDILEYAKTHPTFPHETTANQFFNESQFESYRHLGSSIVTMVSQSAATDASQGLGELTIADFTRSAQDFWAHRPQAAPIGASA